MIRGGTAPAGNVPKSGTAARRKDSIFQAKMQGNNKKSCIDEIKICKNPRPTIFPSAGDAILCRGHLPRDLTQSVTSCCVTAEGKRWPSCQSPVSASAASCVPLSPMPLLAEVQKGMTVLPVKSLALTNVSTGHAAMPHQIGK